MRVTLDLADAFTRWTTWRWRLHSFDGWRAVLIADLDLTYHHSVEVAFADVAYLQCPHEFDAPEWRAADPAAQRLAARLEGNTMLARPSELITYQWDAEVASGDRVPCLIVAGAAQATEGTWPHNWLPRPHGPRR